MCLRPRQPNQTRSPKVPSAVNTPPTHHHHPRPPPPPPCPPSSRRHSARNKRNQKGSFVFAISGPRPAELPAGTVMITLAKTAALIQGPASFPFSSPSCLLLSSPLQVSRVIPVHLLFVGAFIFVFFFLFFFLNSKECVSCWLAKAERHAWSEEQCLLLLHLLRGLAQAPEGALFLGL